jgi:hypothetical protein
MMDREQVRELEDEIESAIADALKKIGNQCPCVETDDFSIQCG